MAEIRTEQEPPRGTEAAYREEREKTLRVVAGGSITEALAGAGGVVLAILGLAGMLPGYMAAISTIAIGVALLALGGAAAARWSRLVREAGYYRGESRVEMGGGLGAEVFGGAAGIVLGILALLGVMPMVLLPIALILFGGSLLLASGVTIELGAMGAPTTTGEQVTREVSTGASALQVLAGVGGVVLGILTLIGGLQQTTLTLTLIGLLVVSVAVLLSGGAVSSRLLSARRH
ncbi:MAG: hypothetical protein IT372_11675 [Polyangiaceae bacterium]|nr:hypothetical protein [Polyangiaceae bacterium]